MTEPAGDSQDREMRLRYNGQCRLCGKALAAGTSAIYERSRRSIRCVRCDAPTNTELVIDQPPTVAVAAADDLRLRAPGSAVITETLRVQASAPPRSAAARLFGRTPLSADSRSWFLGAIGELEVGRVLDQLGEGWQIIHAVPVGTAGSDIDHMVVGPPGVFTINSKYHEGMKVWVASKRILVNGQRTDHIRNAAYEGRRVAKLLMRATGRPVEVTPIVAIVAARSITVRERPTDVVVLSSNQLVRWLQRRPTVLSGEEVTQIADASLSLSTWGDPPVPVPDLVAFATLRESVASARTRRRLWGAALLLSPLAVSAVALLSVLR